MQQGHAARGHAMMRRLDDDSNALRLKGVIDRIGDLNRFIIRSRRLVGR